MSDARPRAAAIAGVLASTLATGLLSSAPAHAIGGGSPVPDGAYRFVAKLDIGGSRSCTGALIEPRWVVTASTCFAAAGRDVVAGPPGQPTTATVGRTHLVNSAGHTVKVVHLIPRTDRNLVLAKLATPITDIAPIRIGATPPATGETLRVAGYGRTTTEWVPDQLQSAAFTVGGVTGTTFDLTGNPPANASICKGDSGGPAFRENDGLVQLVAVHNTSWQHGCFGETEVREGATETRLDDLIDWIRAEASEPAELKGMTELKSGRLNSDDFDDLIAVESSTGKLWLYPGNSTGGVLGARIMIGTGGWNGMSELAVGTFNRDSVDDVAAVENSTGKLWLYPGTASGRLGARTEIGSGGWNGMNDLAAGNFNQDAYDDVAAVESSTGKLWLYPGTAGGRLGARIQIGSGGWNGMRELTIGQLDRDQYDDLVAAEKSTGKLWLYPGTAGGRLGARVEIGSGGWNGMRDLAAGNFTRDSFDDLAAVENSIVNLWLYPGTANGKLGTRVQLGSGGW